MSPISPLFPFPLVFYFLTPSSLFTHPSPPGFFLFLISVSEICNMYLLLYFIVLTYYCMYLHLSALALVLAIKTIFFPLHSTSFTPRLCSALTLPSIPPSLRPLLHPPPTPPPIPPPPSPSFCDFSLQSDHRSRVSSLILHPSIKPSFSSPRSDYFPLQHHDSTSSTHPAIPRSFFRLHTSTCLTTIINNGQRPDRRHGRPRLLLLVQVWMRRLCLQHTDHTC